jgi:hypothetical protein
MDAADYIDWWKGTRLGRDMASAGERYGQLRQYLSRVGGNVVLVGEFLQSNPEVIDVTRWMQTRWPNGAEVRLLIEGLEAVGAHRTATLLRQPPVSALALLPTPAEVLKGQIDWEAMGKALRQARQHLLEQIVATSPDLAKELPPQVRAQLPQPKQTEGADTRLEIGRKLEQYVAVYQDELAADLARRVGPEEAHAYRRAALFREQRARVPILAEKLERLKKLVQSEPPHSFSLQRQRQKVLEEYRLYAAEEPEKVSPEIRAWLQEVERLRNGHADSFRHKATADELLNARLAAIGDYELDFHGSFPTVTWSGLAELRYDWATFSLTFTLMTSEKKPRAAWIAKTYEELIAAWEKFRPRFTHLESAIRDYLIEFCQEGFLSEYEGSVAPDDNGPEMLSEKDILESVEGGSVNMFFSDNGGVHQVVTIVARCGPPEGVEVRFDQNGEIEWAF